MHKHLIVMALFIGSATAQIPDRNCMSNPMMAGCPAAEQARQTQEMLSKKPWWEEHPELLNPKVPGATQPKQTSTAKAAAADSDWKRPRLAQPLPANWPRWNFAQPDAGAVVGLKLKALVQSPVLAGLMGAELSRQWQASAPQLDEVWVSLRVLPAGKTEAVMLMIGPAVDSIAADLRSKGATVCFLDRKTLLAGEWNAVNAALTRVAAGTPVGMSRRAGELWMANDIWMIAGRQMVNQMLPVSADTASLTGASMGMNLQHGVAVDMLLTAATPAETTRLAAKFAQDPGDLGLGQVKVEKTLRGISAHAAFEADQLPDALKQQITDQIRPLLDLARPPAETPASQAAASGSVVIQGLDDGPRVIPVK